MKFRKSYDVNNHFIIAAPRSGTTWVSKMLNSHPNVYCVERRLFGDYADFVEDKGIINPRLRVTLDKYVSSLLLHHAIPQSEKQKLLKSIIKAIIKQERKYSGKKILIDKITPYLNTSNLVLEQINHFFPSAKIIYLVRDGRDVLTSGVFHWFNKQPKGAKLNEFELKRRELFLNNKGIKMNRFFQDSEIEQWANEWVQPIKTINKAKNTHEVKVVYYEDLLNNTEEVLSEVLSFVSAKKTASILNKSIEASSFKAMTEGREQGNAKHDAHIRKGVSGDWKSYFTYEDGGLFHEIAGDELIEYGYEENKQWFEKLR